MSKKDSFNQSASNSSLLFVESTFNIQDNHNTDIQYPDTIESIQIEPYQANSLRNDTLGETLHPANATANPDQACSPQRANMLSTGTDCIYVETRQTVHYSIPPKYYFLSETTTKDLLTIGFLDEV